MTSHAVFESRIISMMPANHLWRKRNLLKVVKIDGNAEHEFNLEWIWFKRRGEKLSLSLYVLSVERIRF